MSVLEEGEITTQCKRGVDTLNRAYWRAPEQDLLDLIRLKREGGRQK